MLRWLTLLLLSWVLGGCAGTPALAPPQAAQLFHDGLFAPLPVLPEPATLMAVSPAMKRHLAEQVQPQVRRKGPALALLDALQAQGDLRLEYDAHTTRTAAEAFEARQGNCLSLVLMTAALARELGLSVSFREVLGPPAISQEGELLFLVGHVNLALSRGLDMARRSTLERSQLVVDFLPGQDLEGQRTVEIDERRIRAMFMNNRAVEDMVRGNVPAAYAWVRAAWAQDPSFASVYNTLGLIYRQAGALAQAEQALLAALQLDPASETVSINLAGVMQAQGRNSPLEPLAAARPAGRKPAATRTDEARRALDDGRTEHALKLLHGELSLTPRNPEVHLGLARAFARLGNTARAHRHLELAAQTSSGSQIHALYVAKLDQFRAVLSRQTMPIP